MEDENRNRILSDMFIRDKPSKILLDMKRAEGRVYPTILSKGANCTYSHTIKVLNLFNRVGLVEFEKKGRIKTVKLTDSGWEIAHNLDVVARKLEEIEDAMLSEDKPEKKADKKASKPRKAKKQDA